MNKTKYGNIAVGQEGSIARYKADIEYLEQKLKVMEYAADKLRDQFVPNYEMHPAIQAYNIAKAYNGGSIDIENMIDWDANMANKKAMPVELPVMQLGHGKKYNIIYADPPWDFGNRMYSSNKNDHHREISRAYSVMKTRDICALPIGQIASEDCVLLMWTTDAHIPDAIEVMKAWGFKYKTVAFIWLKKEQSGKQVCYMGQWTMKNAEIVLLGTKGKMTKYLQSRKVRQLVEAKRNRFKHSEKPKEIRDKIIEMFGNELPKIELFARHKIDGWDAWGDQVPQSA